ncbi:MAG TPA: hypothetical protein VMN36_18100 [Verrucomicrobiales bacterium]|nr:hypothetical protein [Verrucomicrobiales bacterium]
MRSMRCAATLAAVWMASVLDASVADVLQPGNSLPGLRLRDADSGEWKRLDGLRGRPAVLHVFASW